MKEKGPPAGEAGVIALIPLLLILALIVVVILVASGKIQNPIQNLPGQKSNQPTVKLQTDYQNPFDKKTQYVNPFASYKNPFDSLQ